MSSNNTTPDAIDKLSKRELVDGRVRWRHFYELTKPRLSFLSVLTAVIGYLAADPARDATSLISLLFGTSLAACGAAALNQWMERVADGRMVRTQDRPIPSGEVSAASALIFGIGLSVIGVSLLSIGANLMSGLLAALTIISYVLVYTPLKQMTVLNTVVGALPGALPPLIGWAAAEGTIGGLGWLLFAILFFWQLPHFYAIAWTYRKDYESGGFVMLSSADSNGKAVARHSFVFTVCLVIASLLPTLLGYASWLYGLAAIATGIYILKAAMKFLRRSDDRDACARKLFFASIFYLPALLFPLVIDLWIFA